MFSPHILETLALLSLMTIKVDFYFFDPIFRGEGRKHNRCSTLIADAGPDKSVGGSLDGAGLSRGDLGLCAPAGKPCHEAAAVTLSAYTPGNTYACVCLCVVKVDYTISDSGVEIVKQRGARSVAGVERKAISRFPSDQPAG